MGQGDLEPSRWVIAGREEGPRGDWGAAPPNPTPSPAPTSSSMSASDLMVRSAKAEKTWQARGMSISGTDPNVEPPFPRLKGGPPQYLPECPLPFPATISRPQHPAAPPDSPIPGDPPAPLPWPPASSHPGTPLCAEVLVTQMMLPDSCCLETQWEGADPDSPGDHSSCPRIGGAA